MPDDQPRTAHVAVAVEQAARDHWGRLVALLAAQFRRLDLAEDTVQDAFVAAARHWPASGIPVNPAAWLLTAARRRAIDTLRTESTAARRLPDLVVDAHTAQMASNLIPTEGEEIADERLRLLFTCCHPALPPAGSAALVLRLVAGLSVAQIARLFIVSETAMAARITRVKQKIAAAGVPFQIPPIDALPERLDTVLAVIYLVFTEGYAATSGPAALRPELGDEAIRLARTIDRLLPGEAATTALLSLMLFQHSRRDARLDGAGRIVLLAEQDRSRWHHDEIATGVQFLAASQSAGSALSPAAQRYVLQARIASEHATAPTAAATDWVAVAGHYEELERLTASPVVRLNRAVAVAEADGPAVALALLDGIEAALPGRHTVFLVRADLLRRLGRIPEALIAIDRAIELVGNDAERAHLAERRLELVSP